LIELCENILDGCFLTHGASSCCCCCGNRATGSRPIQKRLYIYYEIVHKVHN